MGIKNFFKIKITNKKSDFYGLPIEKLGEIITLSKLKNKRICVDGSLIIYQSILAFQNNVLKDSDDITAHINVIFNKVIQLAQNGIIQIWIFDNPNLNILKKNESLKRKIHRENQELEGKTFYRLNKKHVEEIQTLLNLMNIMYITSPEGTEAEQYGAYLTKSKNGKPFCEYMLSSDSDVLFFGGNLLRISTKKTLSGKTSKTIYQTFRLDDILNELDLTYNQFLKLICLGSDFNEKNNQRIGPNTILKKIDDIELTNEMKKAIEYFKLNISNKIETAKIVEGKYDRLKLIDFLKTHKFNIERVNSRLDTFEKYII